MIRKLSLTCNATNFGYCEARVNDATDSMETELIMLIRHGIFNFWNRVTFILKNGKFKSWQKPIIVSDIKFNLRLGVKLNAKRLPL